MRVASWVIAGFALAAGAVAADPAKAVRSGASAEQPLTEAELDKLWQIELRARELYPGRRDTPLRYLNVTDGEVREIQSLASTTLAIRELVNISPVVTGCPCEEGPDCTEQVYILGKIKERVVGVQLSRRKNRWGVGHVQRWWLEYAALQAREHEMEPRVYDQAHGRKLLEFPVCVSPITVDARGTSADVKK